ncbi:DUF3397 domain-containing protein [Paenibacillus alkalitolerans]|uniref:DUF3397 domain-containing protein n=1 Tax=Paenibacillus alkalitolerans TaxID=2799335 RepID=UPI002D7F6A92|nr:DUF3397 domain-containing protein [Paenibacillus alkalitolerans]
MQLLKEGFAYIYAALSVMPFISFVLVWFAVYLIKKDKKLAVARSMDVSTALLVGSVTVLYNEVFNSTFGIYLLLLLFLAGFGLLGNMQHRKKGRIDAKRIFRVVWRMGFLGLSTAYVMLSLVYLTQILL